MDASEFIGGGPRFVVAACGGRDGARPPCKPVTDNWHVILCLGYYLKYSMFNTQCSMLKFKAEQLEN